MIGDFFGVYFSLLPLLLNGLCGTLFSPLTPKMLQVECGMFGTGENTNGSRCRALAVSLWAFGVSPLGFLFSGSARKLCFASKNEGVYMMPPMTFSLVGPLNKLRNASWTSLETP